jgi:DNA polymerase-3 subunit gamma/tau
VTDLLEHLRHLLLVQHTSDVPESLPVTEETRERLREQANQLPPGTVLRLCDLLAVAVDDMRGGGDPRLPLELALVKATRPTADLSREALAHRIELLEQRLTGSGAISPAVDLPPPPAQAARGSATKKAEAKTPAEAETAPAPEAEAPAPADPDSSPPELERLQEAWQHAILPAISSIPTRSLFQEARPVALEGDELRIEFPPSAAFHRNLADEERNSRPLAEALHELTGARLRLTFVVGEGHDAGPAPAEEGPPAEDDLISLLKDTFDAREVED